MRIRFVQKFIDYLRGKGCRVVTEGYHNKISCSKHDLSFFDIKIVGHNNRVIIKGLNQDSCGKASIFIFGDHNTIFIDENFSIGVHLSINLGSSSPFYGKISDVKCIIGKNVRMEDVSITTYNSHHSIKVGSNCLFSLNVNLYNTDGHPIYDMSRKLLNYVPNMTVEDNCWIGFGATLLKGCLIPFGSIVGWGSVVCKQFTTKNIVIYGNPAKVACW